MLRSSLSRCLSTTASRSHAANALLLAHSGNASSSAAAGSSTPHQKPPPPTPPPRRMNGNGDEEYVSDQEWELRTGRAMDILQQTLPNFFNTGLVSTNYHLPLHIHSILGGNIALPSLSLSKGKGKGKARADEHNDSSSETRNNSNGNEEEEEGIYARTIRLEYTPPVALPAPFPRVLGVEGLPLYVASSVFVRHAMHAIYSDLAVAMHKVQIRSGPQQDSQSPQSSSPPSSESQSPQPLTPSLEGEERNSQPKHRRERAITIGLLVSGVGRLGLSNERAEWDVTSTYTFSPHTGLITLHTVNAIHPEPSETVYAAFQSALSTLGSGFVGPAAGSRKGAMNVGANVNVESGRSDR